MYEKTKLITGVLKIEKYIDMYTNSKILQSLQTIQHQNNVLMFQIHSIYNYEFFLYYISIRYAIYVLYKEVLNIEMNVL